MGFFVVIVIAFILIGTIVCFLAASKRTIDRSNSDKEQIEWIREYNNKEERNG